jgi:hypothetical protein
MTFWLTNRSSCQVHGVTRLHILCGIARLIAGTEPHRASRLRGRSCRPGFSHTLLEPALHGARCVPDDTRSDANVRRPATFVAVPFEQSGFDVEPISRDFGFSQQTFHTLFDCALPPVFQCWAAYGRVADDAAHAPKPAAVDPAETFVVRQRRHSYSPERTSAGSRSVSPHPTAFGSAV